MKLKSLRIQNFRAFKDTTIQLDSLTALVGPNGAGKSTVLAALNVFFRETKNSALDLAELSEDDTHHKDTSQPIIISLTFGDLSEQEQKAFKEYYRVGVVTFQAYARFEKGEKRAKVEQRGERLVMADFKPFFAKARDKVGAAQLRETYAAIRTKHGDLPEAKTIEQMTEALRRFEEAHSQLCTPEPSTQDLYGFTGGHYRLDRFVQWVYVPAVKDAGSEEREDRGNAFGQLLARSVRTSLDLSNDLDRIQARALAAYRALLKDKRSALKGLAKKLQTRLRQWLHDDALLELDWATEDVGSVTVENPKANVLTGDASYTGQVARMGHGHQRLYLCALLQQLALSSGEGEPMLLLAIEEPELYQHPPQARHMAELLQTLAKENAQILYCTHNPHFVSPGRFDQIRRVVLEGKPHQACVTSVSADALKARLDEVYPSGAGNSQATGGALSEAQRSGMAAQLEAVLQPQLNELFFTHVLVLVEGIEDETYIKAVVEEMDKWGAFRKLGCHIVHCNGKSQMIRPLAIAKSLGIPTFVVFDADSGQVGKQHENMHRQDNLALSALQGHVGAEPFPTSTFWKPNTVIWPTNLTDVFRREVDAEAYKEVAGELCRNLNYVKHLQKNPVFVGRLVSNLWAKGQKPQSVQKLVRSMLAFAESVRPRARRER